MGGARGGQEHVILIFAHVATRRLNYVRRLTLLLPALIGSLNYLIEYLFITIFFIYVLFGYRNKLCNDILFNTRLSNYNWKLGVD